MARIRTACLVVVLLALSFGVAGCKTVDSPAMGAIWMDVKGPIDPGDRVGPKMGKACASSIVGIVAIGDASIATAAKNGGITKIDTVDHHSTYMVVFGQFCTIVHGS